MKKFLVMLMMVFGLSCFADQYVLSSGKDRFSNVDDYHPGVAILQDTKTGKYSLYRFTWNHGYWVDKNTSWKDKDVKNEVAGGIKVFKVLVHNGKKCTNLSQQQLYDILNSIAYEEVVGDY